MKAITEMINQILMEWDPIGVGPEVAIDEYQGYIPIILRSCFDKKKLLDCLQNIVIHEMGLEYDLNNEKHNNDIQLICDKIIQVYSVQSDIPSV